MAILTGRVKRSIRIANLAEGIVFAPGTASDVVEESHPGVELVEDIVVSLHAVHKLEDGLNGEVLNAVLRSLRARVDPSDATSDLALADVYNKKVNE